MGSRRRVWVEFGRVAVAAALCGLMVEQPLLAQAPVVRKASAGKGELQRQQRTLHALNRFTFGPTPGEVTAVEKQGLNRWFEQQLNPGSIDDSALDARLAEYPAMQLPIAQLEQKYPGPQTIRRMIAGNATLPSDPTDRAMAEAQIALYKMKKQQQEAKAPDGVEKPIAASEIAPEPMADGADSNAGSARHEAALKIIALPPAERMQAILTMPPEQLIAFRQGLKGAELLRVADGLTPQQKETLLALTGSLRMVGLEETESRVERDVYSNRQLEAVMTDFWLNHFNVYIRKNQNEAYLIPTYERETIRAHALGNFEDLLVATAESPAMLEYLDNFRSIGPDSMAAKRVGKAQQMNPNGKLAKAGAAGLNENYGRELMELHTLGVNGGYTQADVTNVAKLFTGWGLDKPYQGGSGGFVFDERKHEPGAKTVLGRTIHEDGMKEGLEVLHMLAQSPATAHFLCEKLAVRFVADTPPPALVDRMAASYLASHGDIKTVLRTMWSSPEFWSPEVYRAKVKTPEEFVVSAVRASGAEVSNPAALVAAINKLGMPLYGMQTPQGYSWKQDDWVSTGALVSRMNFALVLSGDRIPGTSTEWSSLVDPSAPKVVPAQYQVQAASRYANPSGSASASIAPPLSARSGDATALKERRLEAVLLDEPVSEKTRAAVLGQANDSSVTEQAATQFDLKATGGKGQAIYRSRGIASAGNQAPDDAQAAVMAGLLLGSPEFQRR